MEIQNLGPAVKGVNRKRIGRGIGSGTGKTGKGIQPESDRNRSIGHL